VGSAATGALRSACYSGQALDLTAKAQLVHASVWLQAAASVRPHLPANPDETVAICGALCGSLACTMVLPADSRQRTAAIRFARAAHQSGKTVCYVSHGTSEQESMQSVRRTSTVRAVLGVPQRVVLADGTLRQDSVSVHAWAVLRATRKADAKQNLGRAR
jgi:hypothetical protein